MVNNSLSITNEFGSYTYGQKKDWQGAKSICLYQLDCYAKGFGTACFAKLMKKSFKHGLDGNLHVCAGASSHLFYLYMGMIPVQTAMPRSPMQNFALALKDPFQLFSQNIARDPGAQDEKKFSLRLIQLLGSNIEVRRPITKDLGLVRMVMSEPGKKRWKKALQSQKDFQPFRDLAPFAKTLSGRQKTALKRVMSARAAWQSNAENQASSYPEKNEKAV